MRPHNGRMRGNHSFGRTLAVGATVASIAVILALLAGVARADEGLGEIAIRLPWLWAFFVAGIVAVFALGIIQIVDAIVWAFREHPSRATAAAVVAFFVVASIGSAFSHDAPTGWSYGFECCSSIDCRALAPNAVSERGDGYHIIATGEVIPYADRRIKRSRDEFFHQCTPGGRIDADRSICLYVPDRGF
jgi:hypothetical protein